jgi:SAM-dependent methyltransferase
VRRASLKTAPALYAQVERYYSGKLGRFGPTPLGVDWSCEPTQRLRFVQLLKMCGSRGSFSINDLGCGYGALIPFLRERFAKRVTAYLGVDLSADMVSHAKSLHENWMPARFLVGSAPDSCADYSVASGIFNVKLAHERAQWEAYVSHTLDTLHATSRLGFSVNFLLPLMSAAPELYCTLPQQWVTYCEQKFASEVSLLTNCGLSEFTLITRRRSVARGRRAVATAATATKHYRSPHPSPQ